MDVMSDSEKLKSKSVGPSRAGDVFHYRWAAHRCLDMISPNSNILKIVIEGSDDSFSKGENVFDVTEYSISEDYSKEQIKYVQLKHTTTQSEKPFTLSDLKTTFTGFSKRFNEYLENKQDGDQLEIFFQITTNRSFSKNFSKNLRNIANGDTVNKSFENTIIKYTNLSGLKLQDFCKAIIINDYEGDFNKQKEIVKSKLSKLLVNSVDDLIISNLISLISECLLPQNDNIITREMVLNKLGVNHEKDLFPAPNLIKPINDSIQREQLSTIINHILSASNPIVIHASGGVGKTIFATQIAQNLPDKDFCLIYDCFGAGSYRNRSGARHKHSDGLIQIANELATYGLCSSLIMQNGVNKSQIMRKFVQHLEDALKSLKKLDENANLIILIDAADNAESVAKEFQETSFVHELLREPLSDGIKLVALCRTERLDTLQLKSNVMLFELLPFSETESLQFLRRYFPNATYSQGIEFHQRTNQGNPRVQSYLLEDSNMSIIELLDYLGPNGKTLDNQIENQLDAAIKHLIDSHPDFEQKNIEAICTGLATLPPFVPIEIIAASVNIQESEVISFISDFGKSIWISKSAVQFKDEPTETWFRNKFSASKSQIISYVEILKPLAFEYIYVSEILPYLLLQAEKYNELIELTLTENYLPDVDSIDKRKIQINRLNFAFKAALLSNNYFDAHKLALRAGEELASNSRQFVVLINNTDLFSLFQTDLQIQDFAYKRKLYGSWDGSEYLYSAFLLSSQNSHFGEASSYLRSAKNWLNIFFEEKRKNENNLYGASLSDEELLYFTYTIYNLNGIQKSIEFLLRISPQTSMFSIAQMFIRRLIDHGKIEDVLNSFTYTQNNPYLIIALVSELLEVDVIPIKNTILEECLILLSSEKKEIPKPNPYSEDSIIQAILSFLEVCTIKKLDSENIKQALNYYIKIESSQKIESKFEKNSRSNFLRANAIRFYLSKKPNHNDVEWLNQIVLEDEDGDTIKTRSNSTSYKKTIKLLFPWFVLRLKSINNEVQNLQDVLQNNVEQSNKIIKESFEVNNFIRYEISSLVSDILGFSNFESSNEILKHYDYFLKDNEQFSIPDKLTLLRKSYRINHLSKIRTNLEQNVLKEVELLIEEPPEFISELYIKLCRAIWIENFDDAKVVFDMAIEATSKFGEEEISGRYKALSALAGRASDSNQNLKMLAYRFIRCAEKVEKSVVEENTWRRNNAIEICGKLDCSIAFSSLSRLRDRDEGNFKEQLSSLVYEMLRIDKITTCQAWPFVEFYGEDNLKILKLAMLCLEKESDNSLKNQIVEFVISRLELNGAELSNWITLNDFLLNHKIEGNRIAQIIQNLKQQKQPSYQSLNIVSNTNDDYQNNDEKQTDWEEIFQGLNLTIISNIKEAENRFRKIIGKVSFIDFWNEIISRIDIKNAFEFIKLIIYSDEFSHTQIGYFLYNIPDEWKNKPIIQKHWGDLIYSIGQKYAQILIENLNYHIHEFNLNKCESEFLMNGILDGLRNISNIGDSSVYFNFIEFASYLVQPDEAIDLLDYALSRFEEYIEEDFADGNWNNSLIPPNDISMLLAGFVWAALSSPITETRWQAAYCVRCFADFYDSTIIDNLIHLMKEDKVGSFGAKNLPFYNLNARLFLLISFARISIDKPELFMKHGQTFYNLAQNFKPHILIQKFSAKIGLNIETYFPTTYNKNEVNFLEGVGVSQLPKIKIDRDDKVESYWHEKNLINLDSEFHISYDFGRYWLETLGDFFGLSTNHIIELVKDVIINEWEIDYETDIINDERSRIWRFSNRNEKTYHSHGEYPEIQTYQFYLSYHAMFVVASKLLEKMNLIDRNENYLLSYSFSEWLNRFSISQDDGRWLAERINPPPLLNYIDDDHIESDDSWLTEIETNYFMNHLIVSKDNSTWINFYGNWNYNFYNRSENVKIYSALVHPTTSTALLNALSTCENSFFYKLPLYEDHEMEINLPPFLLEGWIIENKQIDGIDIQDPNTTNLNFPAYEIGSLIENKLNISSNSIPGKWFFKDNSNECLMSEIWGQKQKYSQFYGKRICGSKLFLENLTKTLKRNLIIEININRYMKSSYLKENFDGKTYKSNRRIILFSSDGRCKTTKSNFTIR